VSPFTEHRSKNMPPIDQWGNTTFTAEATQPSLIDHTVAERFPEQTVIDNTFAESNAILAEKVNAWAGERSTAELGESISGVARQIEYYRREELASHL
jgi:hypothetical protein